MEAINKNWTDADGNHAGGQSIGNLFTIVWQRGPLKEAGRNGAFELLSQHPEMIEEPIKQSRPKAKGFPPRNKNNGRHAQ